MIAKRGWRWALGLAAFVVFLAAAQLGGDWAERGLLAVAVAGATGALLAWRGRPLAGPLALAALAAATVSLALRFAFDDFAYHYVWLLSAPQLPVHLRLANLWSGDEGTLLLLGLIGFAMALRLERHRGWAAPGAYLLAGIFTAGALIWDPFRATPPEALAALPYRGMNAHLTRVWMAVHPPLVFTAYMLVIAPWGAMVEALWRGRGGWAAIAALDGRIGWALLSAGIGFGMWWAYEDFTYGALWHWDPVQTAIFASWAFLAAMLHAQRRYRLGGAFAIAHPALGLLAAAGAVVAMAVTRSPTLASSHRYVGETSLPLLLGIAGLILAALIAALILRLARGRVRPKVAGENRVLIWIAIAIFAGCGAIATAEVAIAFTSAWLGLPRPDDLKPFFETLRNFGAGGELERLRAAFAQWDINNFALNRWLAPLGCLIGMVGGHYFMPLARRARWLASFVAMITAAVSAAWIKPFERIYDGTGFTSGKTVAIFPWLDALAVAVAYLALAAFLRMLAAGVSRPARATLGYDIPIGVIHAGVMIALFGAVGATVFDSYTQRVVPAAALTKPLAFPGGYTLRIAAVETARAHDGARLAAPAPAFHSVARVEWSLARGGRKVAGERGHAVYRDERPPYSATSGSVRLMCEMIDYRYARYVSDSKQMIHPLISRGLWRDVQIWVSAVSGERREASTSAPSGSAAVILKVYPLLSWVWIGLLLALAGFLVHMGVEVRRLRRQSGRGR
jgi:cytochrome c-type biogenesis protein CcmF